MCVWGSSVYFPWMAQHAHYLYLTTHLKTFGHISASTTKKLQTFQGETNEHHQIWAIITTCLKENMQYVDIALKSMIQVYQSRMFEAFNIFHQSHLIRGWMLKLNSANHRWSSFLCIRTSVADFLANQQAVWTPNMHVYSDSPVICRWPPFGFGLDM